MKLAIEWIATVLFSIGTIALLALPFRGPAAPTASPVPKRHGAALATAAGPTAYAELPTLGPTFDDDASLPSHAVPVADYTLRVRLDTQEHLVEGEGVIRWRNRSEKEISALHVHLYANAFRSEDTRFLSDRRPGGRGSGPVRDFGHVAVDSFSVRSHGGENVWPRAKRADPAYPNDDTDMVVPLAQPVKPGEAIDVDLSWRTKLPSIVERMGYHGTFHMVAQWFPKIAKHEPDGQFAHFSFDRLAEFYADFGTYDVTISVPETFVVGATGPCHSEEILDGRRVVRHVQPDVHDFAFVAWDGFRELRRDVDGTDVRLLFPPAHEGIAEEQLDVTAFGLRHFGARFGSYPYATLTIVHPPVGAEEAGGMEYPTLFTTGGSWWKRGVDGSARALTLHELAHQYFQGMVATNEHAWPFLDEGLASFAEVDALDVGWPDSGAIAARGWGVAASTVLRRVGLGGGQDDIIAKPSPDFHSGHTYGRLVYGRTALVLATLDRAYDGKVMQAIGRYARRYRFAHPGPEHLLAAIRDVAGEPAAEALRTCLFDRGWVDLAITDLTCEADACTVVVSHRGNVVLPVDVLWLHADGTRTMTVWDGRQAQASLRQAVASPVVHVVLDPSHKILLDEDFSNNAIGLGKRPRAWRTRALATYVTALGFQAVMP